MAHKDAYSIIKKELSSGPKTSEELKEACKRAGIVNSTYYYHLKQLVEKLREAEEISERDNRGRLVWKYALVEEQEQKPVAGVSWGYDSGGLRSFTVGDLEIEYPPNKVLLELAAWIRHDPTNWDADDFKVKRANLCLEHCQYLVPKVGKTREDPDKYAFIWPDEALDQLKLEGPVSSRFFDLKSIYDAVKGSLSQKARSDGLVFLGAYSSPVVVGYVGYYTGMQSLRRVGQPNVYDVIEGPQGVCVAIYKEVDSLHVVHVETREGKLDKAWVSGLAKHVKAKKTRALDYDSLKEDDRRDLLLNLRDALERRRLLISGRYTALIEDLLEYSYKKPSNGYVLALAVAVDLSSPSQ